MIQWKKNYRKDFTEKLSTLEVATLLPRDLSVVAAPRKASLIGTNLNMVLQTYGLSISSDDECVENRLIDNDEIISDRKSVNYSDNNMLAMSPFAGDYPPTSNYINYTDLDASYATQGKNTSPCSSSSRFRPCNEQPDDELLLFLINGWCSRAQTSCE